MTLHLVIAGLTRNPWLLAVWIPDQVQDDNSEVGDDNSEVRDNALDSTHLHFTSPG